MLWILLIISILTLVLIGIFGDDDNGACIAGCVIAGIMLLSVAIAIPCCYASYNEISSTADQKIEVLESQCDKILVDIKPYVDQYINYEQSNISDAREEMSVAKLAAVLNLYPNLKADKFLMEQISTIKDYQKQITYIKLEKASINQYHLWLFTPIYQPRQEIVIVKYK